MNTSKKLLCLLFSILCITGVSAQTPNTAKLDSFFNALEKNNKIMGSAAIAKNGKLLYTRSAGYAQTGTDKNMPADKNTLYRIGSISKMFTTTMIFQLAEEKKLSLNDSLSRWFPQIPNAGKISISQMLNHHSGIYNFTDDSTYTEWMEQPKKQDEILSLIASHKPAFAPGEKAAYSNSNYVLLGYIIEKVTGSSYKEQLQKRILKKLKLQRTKTGSKINIKDNEAFSYNYDGSKWQPATETDMSIPGGAGVIISTPSELTTFITALFNGSLVSKASLDKMTTITDGFGMGMFRIPWYERHALGHNGGIDGFTSSLSYFPDDSVAVALTINGQNYPMNDVLIGMLSIWYNKSFTIPDFKQVALSPKLLSYYEGVYSSKQLSLKITIAQRNGQLLAQATGQSAFPLEAVSDTEFRFDAGGIVMIFKRNDDGNITQFTLKQGGGNFLFEKEAGESHDPGMDSRH